MPSEPLSPDDIPKYLTEGLQRQSATRLREIANYADQLASYKEAKAEQELEERATDIEETPEGWDEETWTDTIEESEAPGRATLTTKEIDGRQYFYYQWREGDEIKSAYVAPVSPSE
ncbi:hypothetical protein [Halorussus halophilus]|uniref:hypothetical protein n=1 Tax=Halorussus halophilus TaxID=2650975 RepID=UPI00130172C8|nr:hypothetical protein [Halorussus halophilus]